jgi:putative phosphoribosyl transferase
LFAHRQEAGEQLAAAIVALNPWSSQPGSSQPDPSSPSDGARRPDESAGLEFRVYALPRGGLPVAVAVAVALDCPLDVIVAKKITRPHNSEFALGAVTADGYTLWSPDCPLSQQSPELIEPALGRATTQLLQFRAGHPPLSPQGKVAIIVDDGIATGMTMAVAVAAVRAQHPAAVWIATPVAPKDVLPWLEQLSDRVIVLATPDPFHSVSRFYESFPQVTMAEAIACLQALKTGTEESSGL